MPESSYVITSSGQINDLGISNGSAPDEKTKVSLTDTTTDYLVNKISAGDFISLSTISGGGDEGLQISVSGGDASTIIYDPAVTADWNGGTSPGHADLAFDQLAERVKDLEGSINDAANLLYTPADNTDWNSSADPGNTGPALDQLADRVKFLEVNFGSAPDASNVTYTPAVNSNWNSSTDPGDTDDALNQLAARVKTMETTPPNASVIPYTPSDNTDWNGNVDPGDVDDALNQLADRMKASEVAGALPTVAVSATDTTPDYLFAKITAGSRVTITKTNGGSNEHVQITADVQDASVVTYTPGTLSDWNGSADPGNTNAGLNQLAARLTSLEGSVGPTPDASVITYTPTTVGDWTGSADPGDVNDALDQVAGRVKVIENHYTAGDLPYTPADNTKWDSNVDPGDVDNALDQLASRMKVVEASSGAAPDASVVTYTPSDNTKWNSNTDPGDTDDALNQLASRVKTLETSISVDAAAVTYTPSDTSKWNSGVDPGNTDGALNQLATRVKSLETTAADASNVTYTPASNANWNGSADPGSTKDGLDQLAARTKTLETTPPDASVIPYTPADNTKWNSSTDPGDVDNALDQLASRTKTLELGGGGGAPDASVVTYTPADTADWDSTSDPGDVDNALDQLAARVKTVEAGGGGGSTSGFITMDTTLNGSYTIPSGYEAIVVDEIYVQSGDLTVTGRLCILESEIIAESADIGYDPNDTGDWNSIPVNTKSALDQLADRVKVVETGGGAGTIISHRWDVDAPPVSASAADDEFNDASFNTSLWTLYDHGANSLAASEDDQGLLLSGDGDTDEWMGIYSSLPSGDFSIATKVIGYAITENNSQFGLALFEDAANPSAGMVYLGGLTSGGTTFSVVQTFNSYNETSGTQLGYEAVGSLTQYLRIRRNGTTFFSDFSSDGESWFNHPNTFTLGYVPQHMGLVFRRQTSTTNYRLRSRFFRYLNTDTNLYAAINGRKTAVLS